jgi:hypothetical protein
VETQIKEAALRYRMPRGRRCMEWGCHVGCHVGLENRGCFTVVMVV